DMPFGGLLRLWRIHHWLGAASFVALLLHPLLASLARAADGPAAVLATLTPPPGYWPVWVGWAALLVMMAFMAPTFSFFGRPEYQRWKWLHRLSGLAAALGLLHAWPLTAALPTPAAFWWWAGLGALATAAMGWRIALSRWLGRRAYVITEVTPLAPRVVELTLAGPPLEHHPGQFVYLTPFDSLLDAGRGEEHPYTLSSAPGEPHLRIAIKDLGDASRALLDVTPGSRAAVEGPYGRFLPTASRDPALWIGGGIGMTPFVSAARALDAAGGAVDTHLIYCANDPSRAYFLAELEAIVRRVDGLVLHAHFFAEEGPLTAAFLAHRVPDLDQRRVLVCGPQPLIDLSRALARDAGVPTSRFLSEEFDLL
ncbi:MAG: ferric reductase-like transmembrane domain-containing protein, partial [Pseudomonadales bacterium]